MDIPGLLIIEDYIMEEDEKNILECIYDQEWSDALSRRVQHYLHYYDYSRTESRVKAPEPPYEIDLLCENIISNGFLEKIEQIIVNEYTPGQGISAHIDSHIFGKSIISLSLGSATTFVFTHSKTKQKKELYVKPRTLMIMSGDARYVWKHEIKKRKTDDVMINDSKTRIPRETRVSVTFRDYA